MIRTSINVYNACCWYSSGVMYFHVNLRQSCPKKCRKNQPVGNWVSNIKVYLRRTKICYHNRTSCDTYNKQHGMEWKYIGVKLCLGITNIYLYLAPTSTVAYLRNLETRNIFWIKFPSIKYVFYVMILLGFCFALLYFGKYKLNHIYQHRANAALSISSRFLCVLMAIWNYLL